MSSVEGPQFAQLVREAEEVTRVLQEHRWDFDASPKIFVRNAACDVVAKEMVIIHDGRVETRIGRLIMSGYGDGFHLMGGEAARSEFKVVSSHILDEINRQIGSRGLHDFPDFQRFDQIQDIEFVNHSMFYQIRDLIFYAALHGGGIHPIAFENFMRRLAAGQIVHNVDFVPALPSRDPERPAVMAGACLAVRTFTPVIEWMPKPIYGGVAEDTMHIVNLLTIERTDVSHPDLPLVYEGTVEYGYQHYYLRRFVGVSPKEGLRGPGVAPQGVRA